MIGGALRGVTEQQDYLAQLSPDGSILLVHAHPATSEAPDVFRAFRLDGTGGRAIWDSTALGSDVASTFIGPEQLAITAASVLPTGRGWTIVDLSGADAIIHSLDVPPIPRPAPSTSVDYSTQVFNYVPLATSADGRWLYALSAHASEPLYRPAYRIAIATGEAQSITAFPTTGPARIVSPVVDPISGRLLLAGPRLTSGPGLVEAWVPGGTTPDFRAAFNNVFGAVWLDDGGVITADYDRLPGPFSFRIIRLSATGTPAAPLFTAEGRDAALVGVQPGFAGAYVVSTDSSMRTLVVNPAHRWTGLCIAGPGALRAQQQRRVPPLTGAAVPSTKTSGDASASRRLGSTSRRICVTRTPPGDQRAMAANQDVTEPKNSLCWGPDAQSR